METVCRGENYVRDIENYTVIFPLTHFILGYRDSVVGIASGYGLDGPGFEPRRRQNFPNLSHPTQPLFPGGYGGREGARRPTHF